MGTGSFPMVKYSRGVLLTTHPLLVPRSWKSRAIPLPTLWATTGPVKGTLYLYLLIRVLRHFSWRWTSSSFLKCDKFLQDYKRQHSGRCRLHSQLMPNIKYTKWMETFVTFYLPTICAHFIQANYFLTPTSFGVCLSVGVKRCLAWIKCALTAG